MMTMIYGLVQIRQPRDPRRTFRASTFARAVKSEHRPRERQLRLAVLRAREGLPSSAPRLRRPGGVLRLSTRPARKSHGNTFIDLQFRERRIEPAMRGLLPNAQCRVRRRTFIRTVPPSTATGSGGDVISRESRAQLIHTGLSPAAL